MTTITTPLGNTSPVLWMQLATTRQATSRIVTNGGQAAAIIHGPRPRHRQSQIVLLYIDETASRTAEDLHAAGGICTITEPGRPTHGMTYIVTGAISRELDPETAAVWIVTIEVTEIPA